MTQVVALQSLFEGLFVRALQPNGTFKERLREKGFDLSRMQPRYPIQVWIDCVDVAISEVYPQLSRSDAWAAIGDRFVEGYFQTLVGRMIATTLPFLSAKTFVGRSPRFISTGLDGVQQELKWENDKTALLSIRGGGELAGHLLVGTCRNVYRRMKIEGVKLEPKALGGLDAELRTTLP
ncbi:MAG: DUF2378 family protein [Archangium sp.]